jgi:hypothetical protein
MLCGVATCRRIAPCDVSLVSVSVCQFHNNKEAEMVILNGFEYKNHFVQEQKLHLIENLYLPGHPMATVILRDITKGTCCRSVLPLLFIYDTYYCPELLWQSSSADYVTLTGDCA